MGNKIDIRRICGNCEDFDKQKSICTIRYKIKGLERCPLPRKSSQKGCQVFMFSVKMFDQ